MGYSSQSHFFFRYDTQQGSAQDAPLRHLRKKDSRGRKKNPTRWARGRAEFFEPKDDEIRLPRRSLSVLALSSLDMVRHASLCKYALRYLTANRIGNHIAFTYC